MWTNTALIAETLEIRGGADSVRKNFKLSHYVCRAERNDPDYSALKALTDVGVWKKRILESDVDANAPNQAFGPHPEPRPSPIPGPPPKSDSSEETDLWAMSFDGSDDPYGDLP
jgi:hypothetical protein